MWVRDWSPKQLIAAWVVYWIGLLGVFAWRPLWQYLQIQRGDGHGTVQLSYSGGFTALALWIAGPPLALFVVWFIARSRARPKQPDSPPVA